MPFHDTKGVRFLLLRAFGFCSLGFTWMPSRDTKYRTFLACSSYVTTMLARLLPVHRSHTQMVWSLTPHEMMMDEPSVMG